MKIYIDFKRLCLFILKIVIALIAAVAITFVVMELLNFATILGAYITHGHYYNNPYTFYQRMELAADSIAGLFILFFVGLCIITIYLIFSLIVGYLTDNNIIKIIKK
jgi:hypothetical protein